MTEILLQGVYDHRAHMTILDITGVPVMDSQVADMLVQAARSTRLLGAQVILTGISPNIAETLVHLGVDLQGVITRRSLQEGIAYALHGAHSSHTFTSSVARNGNGNGNRMKHLA
jgi:rsbT co-antagonist protein RsbR